MKKIALTLAVSFSLLVAGSAFAKSKSTTAKVAKASRADCTKAMDNTYKLSQMTPDDATKKTDLAKCQKEQTKVSASCTAKAASMEEMEACKTAKK